MAKPDDWQLEIGNDPFTIDIQARWADVDQLGHINNVAMAGLFEEGRGRFSHSLDLHRGGLTERWLIAGVEIAYLAESHHPLPVTIATGIAKIGTSSWTLASAAFKSGRCVATCNTTTVFACPTGALPIPAHFREKFATVMAGKPA
jgi:acyl-CoA thioester hydrolase